LSTVPVIAPVVAALAVSTRDAKVAKASNAHTHRRFLFMLSPLQQLRRKRHLAAWNGMLLQLVRSRGGK